MDKKEGEEEVKKDVVPEATVDEQPVNGVKDEPRDEAKPVSVKTLILLNGRIPFIQNTYFIVLGGKRKRKRAF